jgi:hypothetical protein
LDVSPVKLDFWNWRSKTSTTLEVPGILHSVWELPDGRKGRVFACVASKPVSLKIFEEPLTLQPGEATFRLEPRREERSREERVSEGP